ncbi:DUF1350 family protein [Scytonema millei]|uniref:DUF1350 family protein n=1 Tax=Scytonema millei VB511283 TaxID=1245923 RepID=A0A9X5E778_9CYAN|nr:DUF1350 family protein [Scytonema millei]NHC36595.1 DUF1350 family protein [Scytonema millei VB511283]
MEWKEIAGNWVLVPHKQIGIVHFLGGAFVATAPQLTYRWLLEQLAEEHYVVVATPFVNTLDHTAIARSVLNGFENAIGQLYAKSLLRSRYLPIYGVGHSMGCKLHLLIGSLFNVERAGNILISFNNYAARDAIPLVQQLNFNPGFSVEFTPSPLETNTLLQTRYEVRRNLAIKFTNDTIDQSEALVKLLHQRFPGMVTLKTLSGTHTTPLSQDLQWQTGSNFTPLDAVGQWFKQEFSRDLRQLRQTIVQWLNPVSML